MARSAELKLLLMAQSIVDIVTRDPVANLTHILEVLYTAGLNPLGGQDTDPTIPWRSLSAAVRRQIQTRFLNWAADVNVGRYIRTNYAAYERFLDRYLRLTTEASPLASRAD